MVGGGHKEEVGGEHREKGGGGGQEGEGRLHHGYVLSRGP